MELITKRNDEKEKTRERERKGRRRYMYEDDDFCYSIKDNRMKETIQIKPIFLVAVFSYSYLALPVRSVHAIFHLCIVSK